MKKKTIILTVICCLLVCIGYVYMCFNPIIIHKPYAQNEFMSRRLYNPIDTIDFTQGENKIIIYTNWRDVSFLSEKMKQWCLLECRNNKTIEELKSNFVFERVSEDFVETTNFDSRIFFFKNNKLVFSDQLIIESSAVSLYFKNTAWTFGINSNELIRCFSEFKPIYFPVVII